MKVFQRQSVEARQNNGSSPAWADPLEKRPPEGVEVLIEYDDGTRGVGTWTGDRFGWKDCKPDKYYLVRWAPKVSSPSGPGGCSPTGKAK